MQTTRNTGSPVFRRSLAWNHAQNLIRYTVIIFIAITVTGCSAGKVTGEQLDTLSVQWELLGNYFCEDDSCSAAFTFYNRGNKELNGEGWKIYFNQYTVEPGTMLAPELGTVEYINGDFYCFCPNPGFSIAPGDSLVFEYSYDGILIKESDAPIGLYFVLNEGKKDEWIAPLSNYVLKPFVDYGSIFGDTAFIQTIPTAESRYEKNSLLSPVDLSGTGSIIPSPFTFSAGTGVFEVLEETGVYFDETLEKEADFLVESFEQNFGIRLEKKSGSGAPGSITLMTAPVSINMVSREAYRLRVGSRQGIQIEGNDPAGVFYGIQSLFSLVPAGAYGSKQSRLRIPEVTIEDSPRFPYRGFLLDVARNFQSKEAILKLIDLLALYKVNILNLRLTDDEGWRLEIEGLPELTQIGARRGHTLDDTGWLAPAFGSGPFPGAEGSFGSGYYTREDFMEIIKYAAERHIRVVPEICFPSHARAAIKSMEARYHHYMEQGDQEAAEEFRLVDPDDRSVYISAQRYKDNIVCVALESSYHFYETVIRDIRNMYEEAELSLTIFNTGGDEVPVGAWEGSPLCREFLKEHPEIENPRHLHAFFVERTLEMLEKYDLMVTGWEEAVLNKDNEGNISINQELLGTDILPLVWDNTGDNLDLGYRIANTGYPIVICNVSNLYFDLAYTTDPREPGLYWGGFQDAIDPYVLVPYNVFYSTIYDDYGRFRPQPELPSGLEQLEAHARKNILGIQAQLWSETLKGKQMMEYYLLPKLFAYAEKAWSKAPDWETEGDAIKRTRLIHQGWNVLANRIGQYEFIRLETLFGGNNFRIPAPGAIVENGMMHANTAFPGLIIRYTIDGTNPGPESPIYLEPLEAEGKIKLRAFTQGGRAGWITEIN